MGAISNANVLRREMGTGSDFEQLSRRDVVNVKGYGGVGLDNFFGEKNEKWRV